jgi:hypothetical protein
LQKSLLYLPCRHHILEIIIGHVFDVSLGCSSGPDVQLFVRFKNYWSFIDVSQFETGYDDNETSYILSECQTTVGEVVKFAQTALETALPRDDYREFLELVLVFLGEKPDHGVRFMQSGAHRRARWMAKINYSLKIWMFRQQFKLTSREITGLRDVNIFVALVYTKAWFTSTNAVSAPSNDLQLLKALDSYKAIHSVISAAACKKFINHLWYISEELIGLSFFANKDDVPTATKIDLVAGLMKPVSSDVCPKRVELQPKDVQSSKLADFVTCNTRLFFERLEIAQNFLDKDPQEWNADEDYIRAKQFLSNLRVVNDVAERGVALIEQYKSILTKDEEQKQFLLQVVEDHRRRFPDSAKNTLVAELGH